MFPAATVKFGHKENNRFHMSNGLTREHWTEMKEYYDSKKKYHSFFEVTKNLVFNNSCAITSTKYINRHFFHLHMIDCFIVCRSINPFVLSLISTGTISRQFFFNLRNSNFLNTSKCRDFTPNLPESANFPGLHWTFLLHGHWLYYNAISRKKDKFQYGIYGQHMVQKR